MAKEERMSLKMTREERMSLKMTREQRKMMSEKKGLLTKMMIVKTTSLAKKS